jgi:rhodanese-related sulfurtransferase
MLTEGVDGRQPLVLDVRNSYEWDAGHFEGAQRPLEVQWGGMGWGLWGVWDDGGPVMGGGRIWSDWDFLVGLGFASLHLLGAALLGVPTPHSQLQASRS